MNVRELIETLNQFDPELKVLLYVDDEVCGCREEWLITVYEDNGVEYPRIVVLSSLEE